MRDFRVSVLGSCIDGSRASKSSHVKCAREFVDELFFFASSVYCTSYSVNRHRVTPLAPKRESEGFPLVFLALLFRLPLPTAPLQRRLPLCRAPARCPALRASTPPTPRPRLCAPLRQRHAPTPVLVCPLCRRPFPPVPRPCLCVDAPVLYTAPVRLACTLRRYLSGLRVASMLLPLPRPTPPLSIDAPAPHATSTPHPVPCPRPCAPSFCANAPCLHDASTPPLCLLCQHPLLCKKFVPWPFPSPPFSLRLDKNHQYVEKYI